MFNRHSWISSTILYAALLLLPILLYVFFCQGSRIDEATARNFRSLGAAADRIGEALDTFDKYSKNYSLGIDSTLLTDINNACEDSEVTWLGKSKELLAVIEKAKGQSAIKEKNLEIKAVRRRPWPYIQGCRIGQFKNDIKECKHGVRFGQGKLTRHDCRGLHERERRVYDALKQTKDDEVKGEAKDGSALIEILDQFGMEVSMDTKEAFQKPTQHLSVFFDNYFIANEDGDVVFANEHSSVSHDEHRRHRAGVPFASLSSIKDLLLDNAPSPLAIFGSTGESNARLNNVPTPVGHSTVRHIQVDDIDLSVFIHPFTAGSLKLYVVGAVLSSSLADEAIRLRLGPAVDATLTIALLLTLFPIIRFWTAGDRSIFRRINLYSMGASVLAASALSAALLSAVIFKSVDGQALDIHLKRIGDAVVKKFEEQFAAVDNGLRTDFLKMTATGVHQPSCSENDAATNSISKEVFCTRICPSTNSLRKAPDLWWPPADPLGPSVSRRRLLDWWPTSSYVLNDKGKRTKCTQYRNDLPLSLNLQFRDYFTKANDEVSLYRIDSVVRGQQQIVASRAYGKGDGQNRRVAVAIPKFFSIDGAVLPPSFQYAVFDQSGDTIFHSDEDRIAVSNFVDDTGNNVDIRAAISYRKGQVLDLDYDGVSIRGYVKRLHEDVGWTLVIFRNHSLVDRISALAISLAVASWLFVTLTIFLVCALLVVVPRPRARELLTGMISSSTSSPLGGAAVVWSAFGLMILWSSEGPALVVVGLLWPVAIAAATYFVAWRRLMHGKRRDAASASARTTRGPVFAIAAVVLSFSVVPMLSWHTYFRAELSGGLAAYLMIQAEEAVEERKKDFDRYAKDRLDEMPQPSLWSFLEDGVIGFGPAQRGRFHQYLIKSDEDGERELTVGGEPALWFGRRWSFLAYSSVTLRAVWHRSTGIVPERMRSVSDAVDHVIGESPAGDMPVVIVWRWIVVALGGALILFSCYTVVRTKFGYARHIGRLRRVSVKDGVISGLGTGRLLLVKRSDRDVKQMLKKLAERRAVRSLRWDGTRVVWDDIGGRGDGGGACSRDGMPVFVIEDFRVATMGDRGTILAKRLGSMVGGNSIVLCSDVVPLYHLVQSGPEHRDALQPAWGGEWSELLLKFDVGVLCDGKSRSKDWKGKCSGTPEVDELLIDELDANVDFEAPLLDIAERLHGCSSLGQKGSRSGWRGFDELRRWRTASRLRERALRDFRAAAQGRFKTLWAVSSFDERAQLYALAHGGSPNMRRPAAISSLVARGLITDTDPIRLCSEAFGQFIVEDLDDSLDDWRRKGQGDWWRVTWLPLVLLAGLGLLFFINSNPEAIGVMAAIGGAFIGLVPVFMSVFRTGQFVQPTFSSNDE